MSRWFWMNTSTCMSHKVLYVLLALVGAHAPAEAQSCAHVVLGADACCSEAVAPNLVDNRRLKNAASTTVYLILSACFQSVLLSVLLMRINVTCDIRDPCLKASFKFFFWEFCKGGCETVCLWFSALDTYLSQLSCYDTTITESLSRGLWLTQPLLLLLCLLQHHIQLDRESGDWKLHNRAN